jgi:uncharacterized protein (TIGR02271 family)
MTNDTEPQNLIGTTAYGNDGEKIGKVGQVYLDDQSGRPEFVTVHTGLFGLKETFVPVEGATVEVDRLVVAYSKEQVKDAPNVDVEGGHLDEAEEQRLYAHYGLTGTAGPRSTGTGAGTGVDTGIGTGTDTRAGTDTGVTPAGHDTSGPTTDDAMTRSEEQVRVGTTEEEAGRVRLRKYVTTEMETQTVPVRKERAVVETEPITDANVDDALDGPAISEEEHEVVLHEERPVVEKTTTPVERVRLGTEATTDEETVTEEVRKEHVEVEGEVDDRR